MRSAGGKIGSVGWGSEIPGSDLFFSVSNAQLANLGWKNSKKTARYSITETSNPYNAMIYTQFGMFWHKKTMHNAIVRDTIDKKLSIHPFLADKHKRGQSNISAS